MTLAEFLRLRYAERETSALFEGAEGSIGLPEMRQRLSRVERGRMIVDAHEICVDCPELRLAGALFVDHPDFNEAWADR